MIEDSPTALHSPNPEQVPEGTQLVDPAEDLSRAPEAAERPEQVEAADEAQDGSDHASAETGRPEQSGMPEEEPRPVEQGDVQQPDAATPTADTDTVSDPDRPGSADTGGAPGTEVRGDQALPTDEAGEAPAPDDIRLPDEAEAASDDRDTDELVGESVELTEARVAEDADDSSPEAETADQLVDGSEADGSNGTTEDVKREEGVENAVPESGDDDTQLQEPEDTIAVRSTEEKGASDRRQEVGPRAQIDAALKSDSGRPPQSIQERARQAIGAMRNWANNTYLGRRLAGRPMEPWSSNRSFYRSLEGARPAANATVGDLLDLTRGNPTIGYKDVNAKGRSDDDLINSAFAPRDGQYISTHVDQPGVIGQGNHRAMELLRRAKDPGNANIELTTPIFIHRVGE
ncbi:hypothetical protein NRF20_15265 [Streptomyces sp. R-74717]|uniref:hypothetical protein n=1 Tax=Streptomyces sp. R-74717 TaxID=2969820 RepID=UPI0039B3D102